MKYIVELREVVIHSVEVEADNELEARDEAVIAHHLGMSVEVDNESAEVIEVRQA